MKLKELLEKLGVDIEDVDVSVNGFDKTIEEVPVLDFEVDDVLIRLRNAPQCEVKINF